MVCIDVAVQIFPARVDSPSQMDNECIFFSAIHLRQLVELLKKGGVQLKGPLKIVDVTTSMIRLVPANMSPILSDMREWSLLRGHTSRLTDFFVAVFERAKGSLRERMKKIDVCS
jgi:hypothetical protein